MDHVQKVRMRMHPVLALALASATLVACDQATPPLVASLGHVTFVGASPINIILTPNTATLAVGQTVQLFVNLPDTMRSQVLWRSLEPGIAVVTQDGLVTAIAAGQATILARLAFDTNRVAPATIVVPGVVAIPGVVVVP
jgi:Bacterial Ig-like domain (group 2)